MIKRTFVGLDRSIDGTLRCDKCGNNKIHNRHFSSKYEDSYSTSGFCTKCNNEITMFVEFTMDLNGSENTTNFISKEFIEFMAMYVAKRKIKEPTNE